MEEEEKVRRLIPICLIGKFNCILFYPAHSMHSDLLCPIGVSGTLAVAYGSTIVAIISLGHIIMSILESCSREECYLHYSSEDNQQLNKEFTVRVPQGQLRGFWRTSSCDDRRRTDLVKVEPESKHCGQYLMFLVNETKTLLV